MSVSHLLWPQYLSPIRCTVVCYHLLSTCTGVCWCLIYQSSSLYICLGESITTTRQSNVAYCTNLVIFQSSGFNMALNTFVSSANRYVLVSVWVTSGKSLMYSTKSMGPRTDPCGIPLVTSFLNLNNNPKAYWKLIESLKYIKDLTVSTCNTGKRARRKNLRHPRERFLVSNEALPNWRPIEIFPAVDINCTACICR